MEPKFDVEVTACRYNNLLFRWKATASAEGHCTYGFGFTRQGAISDALKQMKFRLYPDCKTETFRL